MKLACAAVVRGVVTFHWCALKIIYLSLGWQGNSCTGGFMCLFCRISWLCVQRVLQRQRIPPVGPCSAHPAASSTCDPLCHMHLLLLLALVQEHQRFHGADGTPHR